MFIYVLSQLKEKVKRVDYDEIKCGTAKLGNKGAVIVKFVYDKVKLCFVCCHLPAGSRRL
jgi:hypothetical protein